MTILLTGAAGRIGTELRSRLPEFGWDVRNFDRVAVPGGMVGDISSDADLDAAVAGVSAIVHLAGQPTEAPWPVIRDANIDGLVRLFEAARRAGVPRVIFASSNHATGFTPVTPELTTDRPNRPDTLYGVSKVFGEALGRYYVDRYGLQVACLRIGTFADRPDDMRTLSTWLSPADAARLVDACLRSPTLHTPWYGASLTTRVVRGASSRPTRSGTGPKTTPRSTPTRWPDPIPTPPTDWWAAAIPHPDSASTRLRVDHEAAR